MAKSNINPMSEQDIKKAVSELAQRVAKLETISKNETELECKNETLQPEQAPSEMEVAQEAHEAALASFNTKTGQSLNSASPAAQVEARLEEVKKKNQ